jgi:serine/threonine-protein kinase
VTSVETGVLLPGHVIAERYRIARVIGWGAMGAVFETEDLTAPGAPRVAVKMLRPAKGEKDEAERRARFLREAAVCATLRAANIVPVLDHGIDAGTESPFLVMPMLAGEDLGKAIERMGALEPRACVSLFLQACDGLAAAHAAGVVHRDIKPSNLFLVEGEDGALRLLIADFGLAKVFDNLAGGALTTSGAFMGTAQYVSPEQATNAKHADARADVWSLAMTLYHALAGRPAFAQTGSFLALVLEVTGSRGVKPLQDSAPWVDAPLARAVHGALVRDPSLRCPSIGELALALRMAIGFDAAGAKVRAGGLRGVSAEEKARIAPRAEIPASWDELLRS